MAVKLSIASVAVCSSIFSSWHNVSKLLRTELSSILPDSESDDSSPRIRTNSQLQFRPNFYTPQSEIRNTKTQTTASRFSTTYGLPLTPSPQCSALARKLQASDQSEARGASRPESCSPNPLLLRSCSFQPTVTRQQLHPRAHCVTTVRTETFIFFNVRNVFQRRKVTK